MSGKKTEPTQLPDADSIAAAAAAAAGVVPPDQEVKDNDGLPPTGDTMPEDQKADTNMPDVDFDFADEPDESELEVEKPSPWMVVEELSDSEMQVEAINIMSHGRSEMLLRFRIDGHLTGMVKTVDRMHYKPGAPTGKCFVTR